MTKISQNLDLFTNRLMDVVYAVCIDKGLTYPDFTDVIDRIEDYALSDLYKSSHTRPYCKRQFLNPVLLNPEDPTEDLKLYISRLSQAVRDALNVFEFYRTNIKQSKEHTALFRTTVIDNLLKSLNDATSVLLVYSDMLAELEECEGEQYLMNDILQKYLSAE